eukprot:CAMPEP_0204877114 /NCGR_PEP_ID=MMETSP1348-20121228/48015_1 /ASSEMBLY_ACC=CAM_ASM_000700 /TAXON_ID=215587 /ORGANISM="Aplanochytrium stocchinoi, Strain GSBS06" /LENGTH=327 /DNA_ID=CAMNT_0052033951 /DNA_START=20 /DNA_END=1003 /DNA_ORIENTATION=+
MTESTVFFMESDDFQDFLFFVPTLKDRLLQSIQDTDFANMFAQKIPIFRELTPLHKYRLGVGSTRVKIPRGTIIKEEGNKKNQNFYIIINGEVDVNKGGKFVRKLENGDYFGEVGLVSLKANTATVKVSDTGACTCLAIRPQVFQSIVVDEPAIAAEISIRLLGTGSRLSDILNHPLAREAFIKHCEKEYAQENIDFWLDARILEGIEKRTIRKSVLKALGVDVPAVKAEKNRLLKERVEYIINKYIINDAEEMVNMSGEVREELLEKINKGEYSFNMFADAQKEVYNMVEADNFTRFKHSQDFQKEVLDKLGRYSPDRASYKMENS